MPKAYANRLCFLSDRRFGPFHRLRDLCHGRSRFRVGFEFAQILLGPRFADRGFPFRHMLLFLAGWSTQLNYLYSVRARPTTSGRKIRPGPNAKSDGIDAIGFRAEGGHSIRHAFVDVTRNSAFMQARARDRTAGGAPRAPRRCAARGSARIVTWRKHCEAKSARSAFIAAPNHDRGDEVHNARQLQAPRRTRHR